MVRTASVKDQKSIQVPFRKFPGIAAAADGAGAAVWVEGHIAQAASSFPVQPARAMQEAFDDLAARGIQNLWNQSLESIAAESPHDAASICEGYALTGGRATSFASGQTLPAMTEVLSTIAGKRLPMVFHVGARALQSQATATRAGHDDILSVAECGWGIVFARDAQEVADLALICRRAAEYAETPFFVVQDAYASTHQIQDVLLPEPELMRLFVGEAEAKLKNYFNPRRPAMLNPVQEEGDYMAARVAQRSFFARAEAALQASIDEFARLTGRDHLAAEGYLTGDAEHILLGCGSMMENALRAADRLREKGVKAGVVTLRAFRPFPLGALRELLANCATVTVFERTDVPLSPSNPVTAGVKAALLSGASGKNTPRVFTAIVGVGSTRVEPALFLAAAENATRKPNGDSLVVFQKTPDSPPSNGKPAPGVTAMALMRSGGSGVVNANRLIAAVSRSLFGVRLDAEGDGGTEKVGKPVLLRLAASSGTQRPCALDSPRKLVVVESAGLLHSGNPVALVMDGGVLLCPFAKTVNDIWKVLPAKAKREIQDRGIRMAGMDLGRHPILHPENLTLAPRNDLVALAAWLRISSFLKDSGLGEQEVYHRMFECIGRLYAGAPDASVDATYGVIKSAYLGMVRFAVPEEKVEIREAATLPVMGTPATSEEDEDSFCEQILGSGACPNRGEGGADGVARANAMPATELLRSYRHDAPEIPVIDMERCVGCMECVALCPDVAILGRVVEEAEAERMLGKIGDAGERALLAERFGKTRRYYDAVAEKGEAGGLLALFVDADRCKGCGECVDACGTNEAIRMAAKADVDLGVFDRALALYGELPDTPERFLSERSLGDMLLSRRAQLSVGGTSSCAGCGQSTAVRLMLSSTGFQFGAENVGVVAASGCDSVYGAVFPYNPYKVPWTNTLSANAPADALGIRRRWDREGHQGRKLWVLGSMENFGGAGLSALTALLASGQDINILVLDSQVFETDSHRVHSVAFVSEGRASAGSHFEPALHASTDLAQIAMTYPHVFVAQTTASHLNHFHKAIRSANEYAGPALVICYATCMAEDGVSEDKAMAQAKLAVESRTFPLLTYDPSAGAHMRERLSLRGNPALQENWYTPRAEGEVLDFIGFAATEGRFAPYFGNAGEPSASLLAAYRNRLANWNRLQEMAGLR